MACVKTGPLCGLSKLVVSLSENALSSLGTLDDSATCSQLQQISVMSTVRATPILPDFRISRTIPNMAAQEMSGASALELSAFEQLGLVKLERKNCQRHECTLLHVLWDSGPISRPIPSTDMQHSMAEDVWMPDLLHFGQAVLSDCLLFCSM